MWRWVRVAILLFALATVAQTAWLARQRSAEWKVPLRVAIYPVAADASDATRQYIAGLSRDSFRPIQEFFEREAARYSIALMPPVDVALAPAVSSRPPPAPVGGSALQAIAWSLHFRYWAWRNDTWQQRTPPHVRVFVSYHDPALTQRVPHSTGLAKGMLGAVNAFAASAQDGSNNVVIAHEVLHTLGATDKYDPATSRPRHPDGYGDPDAKPLHPQRRAEIMGGRIAISDANAEMPESLTQVVVGAATAKEIGWVK